MRRLIPQALVVLILAVLTTGTAFATTYYIAANGSDSNNGTSNTTPWQHAPGMPNCTGTCASTTPEPGDKFIFRGGDTWHFGNSSLSPYSGAGAWGWNWAGSATNCNFDPSSGAIATTSCIYIGVDQTWFTGASWVRPVMNFDNPLSTSFVSSCAYNDDSFNGWFIRSGYVQVDNLEFIGYCTSSAGTSGIVDVLASPVDFSYDYFHGWTVVTGGEANSAKLINCNGAGCTGFTKLDHGVMDGSDSSGASTAYTGLMSGMGACTDVEFSIIRYVGNFCVESSGNTATGAHIYHDNLFEYLYNPGGGAHGNVIEMNSGVSPGYSHGPVYFYNNVARHMDEGITFDLIPNAGGSVYIFNNVLYDIANGGNCLGPNANGGSTPITSYVYNNTFDYQANVQGNNNGGCHIGGGANNTLNLQNNHFVNYNATNCSGSCSGYISAIASASTVNDLGNEVWQSESTANSQGYTASNDYQPTSTSGSTYHNGANSSSKCSTFSSDSALCNGTSGGVIMSAGVITASYIDPTPQRGTTWDAGAYQYSAGSSSSQPNPPTGLAAVVQ
jgi:hypothetical protein